MEANPDPAKLLQDFCEKEGIVITVALQSFQQDNGSLSLKPVIIARYKSVE